jgi:hypothetical protein
MNAYMHIIHEKPSLRRSVTSVSQSATMCIIKEVSSNYFNSISISDYFIKFHYYLQNFYKPKLNVTKLMKYKFLAGC